MCINCDSKEIKKTFLVSERGSGSLFDSTEIEIPLCEHCIKKLNVQEKWFEDTPIWDGVYNEYNYELEIMELVEKLGCKLIIKDLSICC